MQPEEMMGLIQQGEGQMVEFKTSFAEAREAIQSLCAFTHVDGGTVFFGVRDDGTVCGVSLGKKTLEDFANQVKTNAQPSLAPRIYKCTIEGKDVIGATVDKLPAAGVCFVYNIAYVRVGKTNQVMHPDQMRARFLAGFQPVVSSGQALVQRPDESWGERERRRITTYTQNRGLFLAHTWQPSSTPRQVADIVIYLRQHGEGPLTQGIVKTVEYHLGPKFSNRTIVQTNQEENFRLEVSAYGPMLCLARVNFEDGSSPIELERYIDF